MSQITQQHQIKNGTEFAICWQQDQGKRGRGDETQREIQRCVEEKQGRDWKITEEDEEDKKEKEKEEKTAKKEKVAARHGKKEAIRRAQRAKEDSKKN
ncbi:hypothetical protein VTL71DRAFT_10368 [Oculimacula yallundae]|uniref:Uncharacterized protein n=1 Tax=Oculimacula yallundae TaxID=86028 RepID=A0ABR4CST3_9HELO